MLRHYVLNAGCASDASGLFVSDEDTTAPANALESVVLTDLQRSSVDIARWGRLCLREAFAMADSSVDVRKYLKVKNST